MLFHLKIKCSVFFVDPDAHCTLSCALFPTVHFSQEGQKENFIEFETSAFS